MDIEPKQLGERTEVIVSHGMDWAGPTPDVTVVTIHHYHADGSEDVTMYGNEEIELELAPELHELVLRR